MANAEQLKILKDGIKVWNGWRDDRPELPIDLTGVDLRGISLVKANLFEADLSRSNLVGCDFYQAEMGGVKLASANVSQAQLIGANLSNSDVSGGDLKSAKLGGAKLCEARLCGANLSGSILIETDFANADLTDASLSESDLSGANLYRANLTRASVSKAELRLVNFHGAVLNDALLTEAVLDQTIFAFTSLQSAAGLEMCRHRGPSCIDHHTLIRSGRLPSVFLQGCGFSDEYINHLPSSLNQPIQHRFCYVSHVPADRAFALRLHEALQTRGVRCWLDEHPLHLGYRVDRVDFVSSRPWDLILLCCSRTSLENDSSLDLEVADAVGKEDLRRESGSATCGILLLDLDGFLFSPECPNWKHRLLASRVVIDFQSHDLDDSRFGTQIERIVGVSRINESA